MVVKKMLLLCDQDEKIQHYFSLDHSPPFSVILSMWCPVVSYGGTAPALLSSHGCSLLGVATPVFMLGVGLVALVLLPLARCRFIFFRPACMRVSSPLCISLAVCAFIYKGGETYFVIDAYAGFFPLLSGKNDEITYASFHSYAR